MNGRVVTMCENSMIWIIISFLVINFIFENLNCKSVSLIFYFIISFINIYLSYEIKYRHYMENNVIFCTLTFHIWNENTHVMSKRRLSKLNLSLSGKKRKIWSAHLSNYATMHFMYYFQQLNVTLTDFSVFKHDSFYRKSFYIVCYYT